MNDKLVIYDADPDGFGCAYAVWKAHGHTVDYKEVLHGSPLPEDAALYEYVLIADLSFTANEYDYLLSNDVKVTVIDHHPSAKRDIERFRLNPYPYDTTKAACVQVWKHVRPMHRTPAILNYVADRDTWTFALPDSDEINSVIYNTPATFEAWDELNYHIEDNYISVLDEGRALTRYRDKLVMEIAEDATVVDWQGFYDVPFVGAPVLWSEVGHLLLDNWPDAPFSVTFKDYTAEGYRKYSLRSEDHRLDVGHLAKQYGGGGHHNAAGFKRPLEEIWKEGYAAIND